MSRQCEARLQVLVEEGREWESGKREGVEWRKSRVGREWREGIEDE